MEIIVKFSAPEFASITRAWKFAKRQLEPIVVVGAFALGAAWFVAGLVALAIWMDYPDNDAGWLIVWLIVTGAWVGLWLYLDTKKQSSWRR